MKRNLTLKNRLIAGETTIGSWLTIGNSAIAEIMAGAGFDWLTIDMEHSAITLEQAQQMIQTIDAYDVASLIRVGENNPNIIKRAMDTGAHGVIVPMITSREEAERAVKSVKYPPHGYRGVGLARAQRYGRDFPAYEKWNREQSVVILLIEHIDAVNNLEAILTVPSVDAFIVGPYDLSGSMGKIGQSSPRQNMRESALFTTTTCAFPAKN